MILGIGNADQRPIARPNQLDQFWVLLPLQGPAVICGSQGPRARKGVEDIGQVGFPNAGAALIQANCKNGFTGLIGWLTHLEIALFAKNIIEQWPQQEMILVGAFRLAVQPSPRRRAELVKSLLFQRGALPQVPQSQQIICAGDDPEIFLSAPMDAGDGVRGKTGTRS